MRDPNGPSGSDVPLLRVDRLAVSFANGRLPRIEAVTDASLTVYPGQTVAVVGESGCGKSVTSLSLLGLLPPAGRIDRGEMRLTIDGTATELRGLSGSALRDIRGGRVAMIFQEPMTSLNPVFSIGEQILESIRLHRDETGQGARAIAIDALEQVGIADAQQRLGAYPHQFSGGMRQRVMIAMALACRPRLLIADEPTTALDVTIQKQILDLMGGLNRDHGMSIVLITHDLGVVAEYADVVCVMYAGRTVECASTEVLYANPLHPYTRALLACIPTLDPSQDADLPLRTVSAVVQDESEWSAFAASRGLAPAECRPWWPHHQGKVPADEDEQGIDSSLVEVDPGHWLALWRTPGAVERFPRKPIDLDRRRGGRRGRRIPAESG
ncbi:MAG: ABC transporter ATP-binding protein [Planctomycetota bacterium]